MGEPPNSTIRTANVPGGQISYVELASPIYGYKGKLKRELDDVHEDILVYLQHQAYELLRFGCFLRGNHKHSLPEMCHDMAVYYWQKDGLVANVILTKDEGKPDPDYVTHRVLVLIAGQPEATTCLDERVRSAFPILTPSGRRYEHPPGTFTYGYIYDYWPPDYLMDQNKRSL